jgi:hypothetical protein
MKRKNQLLFLLVVVGLIQAASAQSPHFSDYGIVGGRGVWPFLLYLGFLIFLGGSFYTKQAEFYAWTLTREKHPILYWTLMCLLTALAIWFGWSLWNSAF